MDASSVVHDDLSFFRLRICAFLLFSSRFRSF